ncbi:hypothetical protein M153_12740001721 [Pseudoloma neurophilia]|uniref:Uncharacterized protein n=1 Tax=Pseudoloma neurophilia TaxID=146866 RepID=A0A0R0LUZ5_9MICR|nr:hypothetical protein M153_12740001721 [Pseudoloma neurophilia]
MKKTLPQKIGSLKGLSTSFVKRLVYVETSVRLTITIDGRLAGVDGVVMLAGSSDLFCISSIKGGWLWKC